MEAWELGNVYCMEIDTNTDGDELSAVLGKVCEPQTTASMVQPLSHTHTHTHCTHQINRQQKVVVTREGQGWALCR